MATQSVPTLSLRGPTPPLLRAIEAPAGLSAIAKFLPLALLYSLFAPAGMDIFIGEIRLFPFRVILLLGLPLLLAELYSRPLKPVLTDILMLLTAAWISSMILYHNGVAEGLEPAGRDAVDFLCGYAVMRICVRDTAHLRWLLKMLLPALIFTAALLAYESITFNLTWSEWFPLENVSDYAKYQERLGLLRAWGPFPHPILGGFVMASFLALYGYYGGNWLVMLAGSAAALAAFFSLSSAAFMMMITIAGLLAYWALNIIFTSRPNWWMIVTPVVTLLFAIQIFVGGGAGGFVTRYLSLSSSSANYRRLIWEYGSASVAEHPWVGIGFASYERVGWMHSGSIDNYWLFIAVRYGLPSTILAMLAVGSAIYLLVKSQRFSFANGPRMQAGLTIALISYAVMLLTVHAWLQSLVWFTMLIGLAASIGSAKLAAGERPIAPAHPSPMNTSRIRLQKIPERR